MVKTSSQPYESDEQDLDLPKRIRELQLRLDGELREKVTEHYSAVAKELKIRFVRSRIDGLSRDAGDLNEKYLRNLSDSDTMYVQCQREIF